MSNCNALQASLQRRFSKGLSFDANYTWGKALSDITGFSAEDSGCRWANADPTRIQQLEYGEAENDIKKRFALSLAYEIPYGKDFHGLKKQAVAGYHINTISVWQTGKPFDITNVGGSQPFNNRATPVNNGSPDRPNQLFGARLGHPTNGEFFNKAAFAPQMLGTISNALHCSDCASGTSICRFSSDFAVTERLNVQFRAESYNISNTPSYQILDGSGSVQVGNSALEQCRTRIRTTIRDCTKFALKAQF